MPPKKTFKQASIVSMFKRPRTDSDELPSDSPVSSVTPAEPVSDIDQDVGLGIYQEDSSSSTASEDEIVATSSGTNTMTTQVVGRDGMQRQGRKPARPFPMSWLPRFPWMRFHASENCMYCFLCKTTGNTGTWVTGTQNFRLKTVTDHVRSRDHLLAVAASEPSQGDISEQNKQMQENRERAVHLGLQTCFWLAVEEIPNVKYKSLLSFLRHLNVPEAIYLNKSGNVKYDSPDIFNQMLGNLSKVLEQNLLTSIHRSPCVGVGIDESTDRVLEKHLVIIIRYITHEGEIKTTYLKCVKVADETASTIVDAVKLCLTEYKIPITKIAGLGADGAAVMSGEMGGVNALIKQDNPYCIFVHCVCHRLHLAVSQACTNNENMATLQEIVAGVYNYVQGSPARLQHFTEIAKVLEEETVKFKRIFEIRWLSLGEALYAIIRNYQTLLVFLGEDAAAGVPIAIGLYQQLRKYKFVALLHLAADILMATNHLNKLFQFRDVTFGAVGPALADCREILRSYIDTDGPYMSQFFSGFENDTFKGTGINSLRERSGDQRAVFETTRIQVINAILENLDTRFPNTGIMEAMQIFDPKAYPQNDRQLTAWGNNYLQTLLDHYGQEKTNREGHNFPRIVDPESCKGEFLTFKRNVFRNRGENRTDNEGNDSFYFFRPNELMTKIFGGPSGEDNKDQYQGMYSLMARGMCLMVGNAEAERIFSTQNRIKSRLRSRLTIEHLDQLIRLSNSKTDLNHFDFEQARDGFMRERNRRL